VLEARQRDWLAGDGIASALATLDERSRRIVEERWLKVNDDGSGGMTLHELAAEYGVSAERIRQIEVAAMKKMRGWTHVGALGVAKKQHHHFAAEIGQASQLAIVVR
jgi:DNA-directed RNA polymerase sigma subunit (sigma70/sigma32)